MGNEKLTAQESVFARAIRQELHPQLLERVAEGVVEDIVKHVPSVLDEGRDSFLQAAPEPIHEGINWGLVNNLKDLRDFYKIRTLGKLLEPGRASQIIWDEVERSSPSILAGIKRVKGVSAQKAEDASVFLRDCIWQVFLEAHVHEKQK